MINIYADEAEQTGEVPTVKGKPKPLLKWRFIELLRLVKAARWLPSTQNLEERWTNKTARIGDYAEVVHQIRNLAHPARYVEDHYRKRVTARYLQRQFEVVLLCRDWLSERNNKSLLEHMKAEGSI